MRRASLALALALLAAACGGRGKAEPPATPEVLRFPHGSPAHAQLGCVTCHPQAAVLAGLPARPGADDHAPCDDAKCHAPDFLQAPGAMCKLCHATVAPWEPGATKPAPYPPTAGRRALAAQFSHRTHLDPRQVDAKAGFHVACGDCHPRAGEADDVALPGHDACGRCHDSTRGDRAVKPPLEECAGCHVTRRTDPARARRLIKGDLRFRHSAHEADRAGRAIPCITCHPRIAEKTRLGREAAPPSTPMCASCHDDSARTPATLAMKHCETCHTGKIGTLQSFVAPRSHLAPRERPDDHTLAFRKDHGDDAQRDAARCARCHSNMSGSGRGNCDECHQSMEPSDHTISWDELDHGPEAVSDRDRCAVCHGGEFCVACHQLAPRSHFPSMTWRCQDHLERAMERPRSCAACHGAEVLATCAGGCHDPEGLCAN